ncbi:MAG: molybdopterin-dependent oxidoreductase [Bacillota bacterium]
MTNHWIDYRNSDVLMALGVNTAENHPISMKWVNAAREKGGKLIAVDPRFTRTAAVADMHARLRPGTDIAFLGGLMNYAIENRLYNEEYLVNFTNASYLVDPEFSFEDGMFSGPGLDRHVLRR